MGLKRRPSWSERELLLLLILLSVDAAYLQSSSIPTEVRLEEGKAQRLALLDFSYSGYKGNWSNSIVQSADGRFQFMLQLTDVDSTHFCWVAVVFTSNPWNMMKWRAPCDGPVESPRCRLVATAEGDIQLLTDNGTVAWRTNTSSLGVEILHLDDTGNLRLDGANNETLWQSDDYPSPEACLVPGAIPRTAFPPGSSSPSPPLPSLPNSPPDGNRASLRPSLSLFSLLSILLASCSILALNPSYGSV